MSRLNGRLANRRRIKQALDSLALLALVLDAALLLIQVLLLLDAQRLLGEGLHDLKGQKAEDIDNIIVWLGFRDCSEASPLAETLALAEREGCLAILGPRDVLLLGHGLGALIGFLEALEGGVVHFLLVLVVFVVALGDFLGVEGGDLPGKPDLGFLVLLGDVDGAGGGDGGDGLVAGADVGFVAFVVRVLDVLADIFPGEESAEARDLGGVVADQEDEIVRGYGLGAATGGVLGAGAQLKVLDLVQREVQIGTSINGYYIPSR